jgi:hypothetical protein
MKHLKYLSYVLRHKWYVFVECCKMGIPLRGLLHDISKFLPSEWFPYANYFYGKKHRPDPAFDFAWLLHQKRNPHHWQWWILQEDEGDVKIFPMPDKYRKEMLADWRGAGKALGKPDTKAWYLANKDRMILHPETRAWIEEQLGV